MSPIPRHRVISTSALVIASLASHSRAAFVNDFSAYPKNARSCLDTAAAASGCTGNTVTEMNTCLCGNGGNFVLATAKCIEKQAQDDEKQAKDDLGAVYEMLLTSCTDSKTPLGISQAQFLDPEDDDDNLSTTSSAVSSITTFATSITIPPTVASSTSATTTSTSLTTYESVAPGGVTVTVTRGVEVYPTGTDSGKQDTNNENSDSDEKSPSIPVLAAGIIGGLAVAIAALAFLCYRRRKQRKERKGHVGAGGKFAALSSATSLTTMTASPPQGQATTAYNGANDRRPGTADTMQMAAGTAASNNMDNKVLNIGKITHQTSTAILEEIGHRQ
ncbi:hypothetical protein ColLi_03355 [Colletotrichum liriopes]|uniref:Extracellular membrane protein CFEM domain-containing protein n=1 Tax=Colletotrichum liriopes TaxID=708192 RepID=A0AA37LQJ3_9PEZI|nr:hypothetical protein ColLi_03355 [Colletotrichum liriopes]